MTNREEELLIVEHDEMIKIITLNRPPLNIVNPALLKLLHEELKRTAEDRTIRAVILTGSGERAFCAGADMGNEEAFNVDEASHAFRETGRAVVDLIETLPQPVIAAVDGYCAGGGTGLAWACDFVIASDRAKFGARDAYLGMIPTWSVGMVRLARWVGRRKAAEILLMGNWFSGAEGQAYDLVSRVVAADQLMETALDLARHLCQAAPLCIERLKIGIRKTLFDGFEDARRYEEESVRFLKKTRDAKEGIQAFMEKRKAVFEGR
jgi:enoyl-CoA hydratase